MKNKRNYIVGTLKSGRQYVLTIDGRWSEYICRGLCWESRYAARKFLQDNLLQLLVGDVKSLTVKQL